MLELIVVKRKLQAEFNVSDKDISFEGDLLTFKAIFKKTEREEQIYFNNKVVFYKDSAGMEYCLNCDSNIKYSTPSNYGSNSRIDLVRNYYCPECNSEERPKAEIKVDRTGHFTIKI